MTDYCEDEEMAEREAKQRQIKLRLSRNEAEALFLAVTDWQPSPYGVLSKNMSNVIVLASAELARRKIEKKLTGEAND